MEKSCLLGAVCAGLFTLITTSTNAALVDNGGGLIYDDVLDITWAQPDTTRTWDPANTWASGLMLGGVSGWRLPYISVAAGAGPFDGPAVDCNTATELDCRDNELGYMYYQNLGQTPGSNLGTADPDLALFPTIVRPSWYWSGTEYDADQAWIFVFAYAGGLVADSGKQFWTPKDTPRLNLYSWAVHAGNVEPIPVPAAVWLFGSGLLGLVCIARRKKAA